jgi:hypothetical protein
MIFIHAFLFEGERTALSGFHPSLLVNPCQAGPHLALVFSALPLKLNFDSEVIPEIFPLSEIDKPAQMI